MNMIEMFNNGFSFQKMSKILGKSRFTISYECKKLGLRRSNINKRLSDEILIQNQHLSSYDLARKFNVDPSNICKRFKRLGIIRNFDEIIKNGNNKHRKYFPDISIFTKIDRIGCYYLGLFFADGSVYKRNKIPSTFQLSLHQRDQDIIYKLVDDLKLPKNIVKSYKKIREIGKYTYLLNMCRIKIEYPDLIKVLCNFGMEPGNFYKRQIPKIPYPYDFIRGFLDGDGSISFKKKKNLLIINFAITYKSFGVELQKFINLGGCLTKSKSIWMLIYSSRKAHELSKRIWDNPVRMLDRKYKRYKLYCQS